MARDLHHLDAGQATARPALDPDRDGGVSMFYSNPADATIDADALKTLADGCADATAKEADAAGAIVCDVPVNRGQGAALRLGYRVARDGGAQYIVTTDADGQYNPLEIESLLTPVIEGKADFVTGSRRMG